MATKTKTDGPGRLRNHVQRVFRVECYFCGMTQEDNLEGEANHEAAALHFHDRGWREITSRRYQTISIACPECAEKPDHER